MRGGRGGHGEEASTGQLLAWQREAWSSLVPNECPTQQRALPQPRGLSLPALKW